jgi:hypothetical protein
MTSIMEISGRIPGLPEFDRIRRRNRIFLPNPGASPGNGISGRVWPVV